MTEPKDIEIDLIDASQIVFAAASQESPERSHHFRQLAWRLSRYATYRSVSDRTDAREKAAFQRAAELLGYDLSQDDISGAMVFRDFSTAHFQGGFQAALDYLQSLPPDGAPEGSST